MQLHSPYLNPFRAFTERVTDAEDGELTAIENNMSRAVMLALGKIERIESFASFLLHLSQQTKSAKLKARIETLANSIEGTDPSALEVDLQTWPGPERRSAETSVLLIGVRSSNNDKWTHHRCAPSAPRPDAWIYVPGKLLVVFEFKNDDFPLDAAQMACYAQGLGILPPDVPCPEPGCCLTEQGADAVQAACADVVLDVPWSMVLTALKKAQEGERNGSICQWLCSEALAYLKSHIRPPYEGPKTIFDWVSRADSSEFGPHLRKLFKRMGAELKKSIRESCDIGFAEDSSDQPDILTGTISAVYVRLTQDGKLVERQWLGRTARLNLWFDSRFGANQQAGLDFWVEAKGASPFLKAKDPILAWNKASESHAAKAREFEDDFAAWSRAAQNCQVGVYAVRFKGKKRMFKGGAAYAVDGPELPRATPQKALTFLQENREALWRFPKVGPGEQCKSIEEAQPLVRKPAVALWVPLDVEALKECGDDADKLQKVLREAVDQISKIASS